MHCDILAHWIVNEPTVLNPTTQPVPRLGYLKCVCVFSNKFVIQYDVINFWINDMQILREIIKKARLSGKTVFWQFPL